MKLNNIIEKNVLERRKILPEKPSPVILEGTFVRLGPVPKFIMPRFEIISRAGCDERVGAILKILLLSAEPRSS